MNNIPSTTITVKKVKEFLWGRHVALIASIILLASSFLTWASSEGVSIKGSETDDAQIIIALSILTIILLFFQKAYKVALAFSLISLVVVISSFIEVSGPMEATTDAGAVEIIGQASIGLYLALISGVLAAAGILLQIFKK